MIDTDINNLPVYLFVIDVSFLIIIKSQIKLLDLKIDSNVLVYSLGILFIYLSIFMLINKASLHFACVHILLYACVCECVFVWTSVFVTFFHNISSPTRTRRVEYEDCAAPLQQYFRCLLF